MGFIDDNTQTLTCPACGKEMKKYFLQDSNVNIDICLDGCGGIFFDNREFEKFDEKHENADEIFAILKDQKFIEVDQSKTRTCPLCDIPMVKHGSASEVEIDTCNICGGKFLDYGELEKIRNQKIQEPMVWAELLEEDKTPKGNKRRLFFEKFVKRFI